MTQVLSTTTLGTPSDAKEMDDQPSTEKRIFITIISLHIQSERLDQCGPQVGEKLSRSLSRKSDNSCTPWQRNISLRSKVVSEVLSSNGSTSMGSVCGSTLSLLDAGVPLKAR